MSSSLAKRESFVLLSVVALHIMVWGCFAPFDTTLSIIEIGKFK